jgi:hypothetical protein
MRIDSRVVRLSAGEVAFTAYDLTTVFAGGFILGDRDVIAPTWTTASYRDRLYGYLCDGETGKFSNGSLGKKLR